MIRQAEGLAGSPEARRGYGDNHGIMIRQAEGLAGSQAPKETVTIMVKCGLIKEAEHLDWEWHDGKMKTQAEYRLLKCEWENLQNGKQ